MLRMPHHVKQPRFSVLKQSRDQMKSFKFMSMCSALWCALHASGVGAAPITAMVGGPEIALTLQPIAGTPNYSFDQLKLDSGVLNQYLSNGSTRPTGNALVEFYGGDNKSAMRFVHQGGLSIVGSQDAQVKREQGRLIDSLNGGRVMFETTGTVGVDMISPITSATFDQDSGQLLAASTNSSFNWTAPSRTGTNPQTGGSISFSNLSIDFQTRTVSATVAGQSNNGTTLTPQTLSLFNFTNQQGVSGLPREALRSEMAGRFPVGRALDGSGWNVVDEGYLLIGANLGLTGWGSVSGLSLTQEGQTAITQALGLTPGTNTLFALTNAANDFGGIDFGLGLRLAQSYDWKLPVPPYTPGRQHAFYIPAVNAIPEPGTWALMALGLLTLPFATQRKARPAC